VSWLSAAIAYTRPRSVPVTLAMAVTGWLASPSHPRTAAEIAADVAFLAIVHSVLLWGGTNAFNSDQDQDTGPVNLMPDPPPRPPGLGVFGLVLMGLSVPAAALRGPACAALAATACGLSIFYSWRGAPWRRGKEIPGIDNAINALGCGAGSFGFGWCTTGEPVTPLAVYLALAWSVCLFGGMPTAQIFQLRPGEGVSTARNWTAWLGAPATLRLGAALFLLHFCLLAPLAAPTATTWIWGAGILAGAVHSAWWSRDPWTAPYDRMLRQMTLLTGAQLAWAIGRV
jgi:hypothetical protein